MFYLRKFHTKDLGNLKYFLSIENLVIHYEVSVYFRKYLIDLLNNIELLGCNL